MFVQLIHQDGIQDIHKLYKHIRQLSSNEDLHLINERNTLNQNEEIFLEDLIESKIVEDDFHPEELMFDQWYSLEQSTSNIFHHDLLWISLSSLKLNREKKIELFFKMTLTMINLIEMHQRSYIVHIHQPLLFAIQMNIFLILTDQRERETSIDAIEEKRKPW